MHFLQRLEGAAELFAGSCATVVVDGDGRIAALTGDAFEGGSIGRMLSELGRPAQRVEIDTAIQSALRSGVVSRVDLTVTTENNGRRTFRFDVVPARDRGTVVGVLLRAIDVTVEREELKRLRARDRLMIDTEGAAQLGVWEWDPRLPHANWSDGLFAIYQLDPKTHVPTYADYLQRVHPDDRARVMAATESVFRGHAPYSHDERVYRADGEIRHLHTWAHAVLDDGGNLVRLVGVCQDVTERILAEEALRRSLAEQEVLLREVQHRVKNNLQVIASLLRLQMPSIDDPALRAKWSDNIDRIRAMALVHSALMRTPGLAVIELGQYVRGLASAFLASHSIDPGRIRVTVTTDEAVVGAEPALPCGLIVNELLANAVEHAFPDNRAGAISIDVRRIGENGVELVVSDNGVGLSRDPASDPDALGFRLVHALVAQLGGAMDVTSPPGTTVRIKFDVPTVQAATAGSSPERRYANA